MKRKISTEQLYVIRNSNHKNQIHYPPYDRYDYGCLSSTLCGKKTERVKRTLVVENVTCGRCIEVLKMDGKLK